MFLFRYSLILFLLLAGCAPSTPVFVAQVALQELEGYKSMKNNRMVAAIEEEGDLLTFSAMAIRDAQSEEAEKTYLIGYHDKRLSDDVRAIALYQIGLIYMNRYNDQRDDGKALNYLYRLPNEFPQAVATRRARVRIDRLYKRADEPIKESAQELIARWKPSQTLDLYKPGLDQDMTLLSRRAVLTDRVAEAEQLYMLAISDPGVPSGLKEKALYQLGLMYLAADNPTHSRDKGIHYLRRLLTQFPDSELSDMAALHLSQ